MKILENASTGWGMKAPTILSNKSVDANWVMFERNEDRKEDVMTISLANPHKYFPLDKFD